MEKGLAFLIFVSSAVSAFCMWGMTYTFFTGKVPFDIQTVILVSTDKDEDIKEQNTEEEKIDSQTEKTTDEKTSDEKTSDEKTPDDKTEEQEVVNKKEDKKEEPIDISYEKTKGLTKGEFNFLRENYVIELYKNLIEQEKKVKKEQEILFEKQRNIEVTEKNVKKLQTEMKLTEERVQKLMITIKKEETNNLKNISNLIASLELGESQKILLEYNDAMIARILRFMNKKSASKILTGLLKDGDEQQVKRIKIITEQMRRLMEEK